MKNEILKFDAPELQGLEKSKADQIKATFEPMAKMLNEFEDRYNKLMGIPLEEMTIDLTNEYKRLRLDIGKVRIETGKIKDKQKEYIKLEDRAIMGVHNILVWAVKEKEDNLKEREDYFEIQEQKRKEALQKERAERLSKYIEDAHERDLVKFEEDEFEALLAMKKKEKEDRIAAEKKAEEDRIAKEKAEKEEQERIRKENERLRKEAEEKERLAKIEKAKRDKEEKERIAKAEAEQKERERIEYIRIEKERKEREQYEAELKKERDAKAKIEAELKEKAEAEQKEKERVESERIAKESAPDKQKLLSLINDLKMPELILQSEKARQADIEIRQRYVSFKKWATSLINEV